MVAHFAPAMSGAIRSGRRGARAIGVTPARVNEIVRERRGITADTALRLARVFQTDVQSWMSLQARYDILCAEDAIGKSIEKIKPLDTKKLAA